MKHSWNISAVALSLILAGCGGDGDNGSNTQKGQLIDSAVAGVSYQTPSSAGVTSAQGEFNYLSGEQVSFSIGQISFPAVTATAVVTPLTLAGSTDINDPVVINIARLLQSLDNDANPDNGIDVTGAQASANLDFTLSVSDFEMAAQSALGITLISEAQALAHLQSTLDDLNQQQNNNNPLEGLTQADVPADLVGIYQFRFDEINAGSGIADQSETSFEVSADGALVLESGTSLAQGYFSNELQKQIIWYDPSDDRSYALSFTDDFTPRELNVFGGAPSSQTFFGQYVPVNTVDGVPEELASITGDYTTVVNFSKAGNRANFKEGDELTLNIGANGVIDIAGVYQLNANDDNFSLTDDSNKAAVFSPNYTVTGSDTLTGEPLRVLLYVQDGELTGFRVIVDAQATDGVNVLAFVTPLRAEVQTFFSTLDGRLPATLTKIKDDPDYNSGFDAPLCEQYAFSYDADGAPGDFPAVSFVPSGAAVSTVTRFYFPTSSGFYSDEASQAIDIGGFRISLTNTSVTARAYRLDAPRDDILTNDAELIAQSCP